MDSPRYRNDGLCRAGFRRRDRRTTNARLEPEWAAFRKLLNQNCEIPAEASRVHGYTREILERDGEPAGAVYEPFRAYAGDLPLVSYNAEYDLDLVLLPEWKRLGIAPIGRTGLCVLWLAQRLLDPVPAGNCKLQTLRQYYRLPEHGAHTALGDVETVAAERIAALEAELAELKTKAERLATEIEEMTGESGMAVD